jgi:RHS repeat-associated protein
MKTGFELCNHLGNVIVTVSDRKLPKDTVGDNSVDHFRADVMSAWDYYAFGMQMPGRNYNLYEYRFGFNGQEKDNQIYGSGNSYTAEFWQYDARLGRRWNVDPMAHEREWLSPYNFVQNNPILRVDPTGALDTKYEDENGNLLAETNDGNSSTVIISSEKENQFKKDLKAGKSEGWQDQKDFNKYLIKNYSKAMVVQPGDNLADWAIDAITDESGKFRKPFIFTMEWKGLKMSGKGVYHLVNTEFLNQVKINNNIRGNNSPKYNKTPLKIPKSIKFLSKYGGFVLSVYGYYDVHQQWRNGEISTGKMIIEQGSNAVGSVPVIGTAWTIGWNFGKRYGPSTWDGDPDPWWEDVFQ